MARKQTQKEIQQLLDRSADGSGYGDPDARLNDDRKIQNSSCTRTIQNWQQTKLANFRPSRRGVA
jgi:hypothetical protein